MFKESDAGSLEEVREDSTHVVQAANGGVIRSTKVGSIVNPLYPVEAKEVLIFKDGDLPSYNLLSVRKFTNAGMTVMFEKDHAVVTDVEGRCVEKANYDSKSNMYLIEREAFDFAGVMFPKTANIREKTRFFIAAMGSPTTSTLLKATQEGWVKFPGITSEMIKDHPHSEATAKGHLDRTRAGLDSTSASDAVPTIRAKGEVEFVTFHSREAVYADLAGRFPVQSTRGMEYIMVMKFSDTGYIHVEPMRTRQAKDFVDAFERSVKFFRETGAVIASTRIDNETSALLRESLRTLGIQVSYVAPHNHRQNPAERDIRTFKNHMIATLCTADNLFPLEEWDLLLPQVEMTLNLMRGSIRDKKKSAWEEHKGPYDFNRNPIAPVGTRVTIYVDPATRGSWEPHGVRGFYLGPAMEHYRCYNVLVEKTRGIRVSDSLAWHPKEDITTENIERLVDDAIDTAKQGRLRRKRKEKRKYKSKEGKRKSRMSTDQSSESQDALPEQDGRAQSEHPDQSNETQGEQIGSPVNEVPVEAGRRGSRKRRPNRRYQHACTAGMVNYCGMAKAYRVARKGPDGDLWEKAASEEFERLIDTTQTMAFIPWERRPKGRIISYYNPQIRVKERGDGSKEYRVRGTYGGNISDYNGPKAANTADMVSIKVLLNAVVSEEGAQFMTADIKDFYLGTPMDRKEYMRIHLDQIPEEARRRYIRDGLVKDDCVLAEVSKGIYGLAQAGRLAQKRLFEHLNQRGYHAISPLNPCIFRHERDDIVFCLVVDDFGVKYREEAQARRLMDVLKEVYTIKEDWSGTSYVGFNIAHDQVKGTLTLSMPRYVEDAAARFDIDTSTRVNDPLPVAADGQMAEKASDDQRRRVQQIVGVMLYYARAVDAMLLVRVSKIASEIVGATLATLASAEKLVRYAATQEPATCTFYKSDMKLTCYSDASYLQESDSRSRRGGYTFLGNEGDEGMLNGPILCSSSIVDVVVASAAESEYAAAFMNGMDLVHIRETLIALGYKQGPTPIVTDNSFVAAIVNSECKPKRAKSMDMRFNWLICRSRSGQLGIKWIEREKNIADYFTKDLRAIEYPRMRKYIVPAVGERVSVEQLAEPSRFKKWGGDGQVCEGGVFKTEHSATHKPHQPTDTTAFRWPRGIKVNPSLTSRSTGDN